MKWVGELEALARSRRVPADMDGWPEEYHRQFRLRMHGALRENLSGLFRLCEPPWWEFLEEKAPRSWTLERIADGFDEFLAVRGAPAEQVEIARLDLAVGQAFSAADDAAPLKLHPATRLLRLSRSVHRWRAQAESPDPIVVGDFPVVVYRLDRQVRTLELPPAAFDVLGGLDPGLEAALEGCGHPPEALADIGHWFKTFVARGIIGAPG